MSSNHYVYEILVDGVVRYFGMGTGDRINAHIRAAKVINQKLNRGESFKALNIHIRLAEALRANSKIDLRTIACGLSKREACSEEIALISGAPKHQLWNEHRGGGGADPDNMKRLWADPLWRSKQQASLKAKWNDPTYRNMMKTVRSDPNLRKRISECVQKRFSDENEREKQRVRTKHNYAVNPDRAKKQGSLVRAKWADPANRERYRKAVTAHWSDPSHRQRQSEAAKRQWADPDQRKKQIEGSREAWTPERRAQQSERARIQFSDPEQRKRQIENGKARFRDPVFREKMESVLVIARALSVATRMRKAALRREKLRNQRPQDSVD